VSRVSLASLFVASLFVAAALIVAVPSIALACPTCFAGVENRSQYFLTFVLMTVLPLGSVAAIVLWLRHKFREARATRELADE
jgi:hypothetical protein